MTDTAIRAMKRKKLFWRTIFRKLRTQAAAVSTWLPAPLQTLFLKPALVAVTGLVIGGLTAALLQQPFEQRVMPQVLALMGGGYLLQIYDVNGALVKPDDQYHLYTPTWGSSASGRMVQVATEDELLRDRRDQPRQFSVSGRREDGRMVFTFVSLSTDPGYGTFIGDGSLYRGFYIGEMRALAHDASGACREMRFWTIVGDPAHAQIFPKIMKDFVARSTKPKSNDAVVMVPCNEGK